jgi:adenylate cyclase
VRPVHEVLAGCGTWRSPAAAAGERFDLFRILRVFFHRHLSLSRAPMIDLERIKERKLFQWAVAYLAGAWLLLQIIGLVGQPFAWPDLVMRAATVLVGIGFPAALVLAWYHGEQGRQKASGVELLMLAGILLIAGVAVTWVARGGEDAVPATAAAAPEAVAGAAAVPEQGSIAVLPFADMSPARDQEYFSDGLTEELLNVLAQIPELRVAARTSSFSFKGKNLPVDSVGRVLKVGHVLEGSIRKAGDQVRITAQLIDARTGFHLWSGSYDREVKDVFAVQDEISRAVAEQLRLKLTPGALLARVETSDPEAHTLLLRGIAAHRHGTRESDAEAQRLFQQAVERDPGYAQAHARLANTLMLRAYFRHIPLEAGYAEARSAAERALALDPRQSEAHAVLGSIAELRDWDFAAAEAHFGRALEANPGDARARSLRAWLFMRLGRSEEAVRESQRATELDPLSMAAYNNLGAMYMYVRQPQRGIDAFQAALALAPDAASVMANLAMAYSKVNRHADAIRTAERARELDPGEYFVLATLGYTYARAGNRAEAERFLAALQAQRAASPYLIATVHTALGDRERAFAMLEQAVEKRDDFVTDLGVDPVFDELRDDPRMRRLLQRMKLPS